LRGILEGDADEIIGEGYLRRFYNYYESGKFRLSVAMGPRKKESYEIKARARAYAKLNARLATAYEGRRSVGPASPKNVFGTLIWHFKARARARVIGV
jgi:hypothetical protein